MKRSVFLLIVFCIFVNFSQAQVQRTIINACAEGAENRTARLYLECAMTRFQWKVDEQIISNDGCFQLTADISQTLRAFIRIDFYQTFIFLQPGEIYNIIFDSFDFRIDERVNPFSLDQFLSYRFEEADSNELNRLIWRFENMYDQFIFENFLDDGTITHEAFNNFENLVRETFAFSGHGYFLDYKRYALADVKRIFRLTSPANLFFTYIQDRPILYNNTAFSDFITGFFEGYFPYQIRYNRNVFVDQINRANNLTAIMDSLGRDTILQNEQLREFVFLLGLREMWQRVEFSNTSILKLLSDIKTTTEFPEHEELAYRITRMLLRFEPGVNTANFRFTNPETGELHDFSLSSRYKYILFVVGHNICPACEGEISILRQIAENEAIRNLVDFYVVSCDYEVNRALRNRPRELGNITFLHFNRDFEALESIGLFDFPTAIWLDGENIIQSYGFLLPSRRAERAIRQLLFPGPF
ncbi:MAG: hypothetical protein FWC98_01605 [Bacteroidales bacterium]|nr:hypothetical protein [Bacteroidales bacterium]